MSVWNILSWLLVGAIVGSLARAILPGRIGKGLIVAILLGVAGAFVGGWLSSTFLNISIGTVWDVRTWLIALGGSIVVLFVWGILTSFGKKKK